MSRIGLATGESVGTWRATGPAPSIGSIQRVRVADPSGLPGEALIVGTEISAEDRAQFAARHRALIGVKAPRFVRTLEVIEEPTRVIVVREPTEDHTLAAASLPLPSDVVAAIGAQLATAVQDGAVGLAGALFLHDIALDAGGRPVFAPVGLSMPAIARSALGHVAPEAFRDATSNNADAALYGLGAVLYQLTTGRSPTGRSDGATRPPVPASTLRHGVPAEHDRALATLLDGTPSARRAALPLLQAVAGTIPDLRPSVTTSRVGEMRFTTTADSQQSRRNQTPGALIVIDPEAWPSLSPSQHALAAGLAGIGMRFADAQIADGHPLVVDTAAGSSAASARATELSRAHGMDAIALSGGGVPWVIPFLLGGGIAAAIALIGLFFVVIAWWPLALATMTLATLVAVGGAAVGRWAGAGRRATRNAVHALEAQRNHQRQRSPDGRLDAAWNRVASLRVQLAGNDRLPEPALADLRSALKDTEDRLEAIAEAVLSSGTSLKHVDSVGLRTRLNALEHRIAHEPELVVERDRLASTVADLDAVDAQRLRVLEDVRHVDSDLNDIAAALGRVGAEDPEGLLNLAKTVSADERRRKAQASRSQRE